MIKTPENYYGLQQKSKEQELFLQWEFQEIKFLFK